MRPVILSYRSGCGAGSNPCTSLNELRKAIVDLRIRGMTNMTTDYDHLTIEIDGVKFVADRPTLEKATELSKAWQAKKTPKKAMFLWVRIGDGGSYEKFDDLESAAEHLAEYQVVAPLTRRDNYGVESPNHTGLNYISIFWGDKDAQPTKKLHHGEIKKLSDLVDTHYEWVERSQR